MKVKFTSDNPQDTYQLRKVDKNGVPTGKVLVWCDEKYPVPDKTEKDYSNIHDVTEAEAAKMGEHLTNGNLTVVEEKKKASK